MQIAALSPTVIRIAGRDRLKWFHSHVSNEIRQLTKAQWCEAFVTDVKGRTLSHGYVFHDDDAYYFLSLASGQEEKLIQHWDRYIISEQVELTSMSSTLHWLVGPTNALAQSYQLPTQQSDNAEGVTTVVTWCQDIGIAGGLVLKSVFSTDEIAIVGLSRKPGIAEVAAAESEARACAALHRVPWFGIDFNENNLPQEVDRDSQAISFKKGCYLGQETVARLDALGQVQKKLFAVSINNTDATSDFSVAPVELLVGDAVAGTLTSAYSTEQGCVGFAMLKRKYFSEPQHLTTATGVSVSRR